MPSTSVSTKLMGEKNESAVVDGSTQQSVLPNGLTVSAPNAKYEPMVVSTLASNPTSPATRSRPSIVLLFVGVLFEILFGYVSKTNNRIHNAINENTNQLKCDLCKMLNVNMNVAWNGLLYPQPPPAPPQLPIVLKFIRTIFYVFVHEINNKINDTKNEEKNELECKCNFENVNCDCDFYDPGHLCYGPRCPSPHPQPSRPIVLLFIEIIFRILLEYIFKYDMYEILNENENELEFALGCDFKNASCEFGFYNFGESLPPTPCHHPTLFNFTNSRVESREQLVLKGIFNGICNGNNIISDNVNENNNENFYDNEYDCGVLLSPPSTDAPSQPTIYSNGIDTGVCKFDILKDEFGVYLCERDIIIGISSGIATGV